MKYLIILTFFFYSGFSFSQTVLKISVKDKERRTISGVIVSCAQTRAFTDASGFCIIKNTENCKTLQVHKLGFADTSLIVPTKKSAGDTIYLSVFLRFNPTYLPEVAVNTSAAEELNPLKADFILDYELCGNFLVTLLSNDYVVVTDLYNAVMSHSKPLNAVNAIDRDPFGYNYLLTDTKAYLFAADSDAVRIDMNWKEKSVFANSCTYIDQVLDSLTIVRKYGDVNQTITFFIKARNRPLRILKTIGNDERANAVKVYAAEAKGLVQYVSDLGLNLMNASTPAELKLVHDAQHMSDMLEMHYSLPAYSLARLVNDSLYLFAHDLDSIFVYDKTCTLKRGMRITYHHLKTWDKELIVNEEKTKVYAKLNAHNKPVLAEINLLNGQLKTTGTVLESAFPKKIRIKQNKVYYLSKRRGSSGSTVYMQALVEGE